MDWDFITFAGWLFSAIILSFIIVAVGILFSAFYVSYDNSFKLTTFSDGSVHNCTTQAIDSCGITYSCIDDNIIYRCVTNSKQPTG